MKDLNYYLENFNNVINESLIVCPICGLKKGNLLQCLKLHNITSKELKARFGNILITCPKAMINAANPKVRKQAAKSNIDSNEIKRYNKFLNGNFKCKICNKIFSYEEYKSGKRKFCGSSECRQKVNSENGKKANPLNISNGVKKSCKFKQAMKNKLNETMSNLEKSFYDALLFLNFSVEKHKVIFNEKENVNYFVDFYLPEKKLYIEIDGYYHFDENGNYFYDDIIRTKYFLENGFNLIRIKFNKNYDIISKAFLLKEYLENFQDSIIIEDYI